MRLGIIGGTGLSNFGQGRAERVGTRWGESEVRRADLAGHEVIILPRHGSGHHVPPHRLNYRANMAALKTAGVTHVIATAAVGTLTAQLPPGTLALVTDYLDLTSGRECTFFDEQVVHLDASEPCCPCLRSAITEGAGHFGLPLVPQAVYACTNGPRFETRAEIAAIGRLGGHLVGMTGVPEFALAKEAELCYAALAIATNWAAGLAGQPLTHEEVTDMMAQHLSDLGRLFGWLAQHPVDSACGCGSALGGYANANALRQTVLGRVG